MTQVEPAGIAAEEASHPEPEVRQGRLDHCVMVRIHQTACVTEPAELASDARKARKIRRSIAVVLDDATAVVARWDDVVDCACGLRSSDSRHPPRMAVVSPDYQCPKETVSD